VVLVDDGAAVVMVEEAMAVTACSATVGWTSPFGTWKRFVPFSDAGGLTTRRAGSVSDVFVCPAMTWKVKDCRGYGPYRGSAWITDFVLQF
jgi:hypothetical protein